MGPSGRAVDEVFLTMKCCWNPHLVTTIPLEEAWHANHEDGMLDLTPGISHNKSEFSQPLPYMTRRQSIALNTFMFQLISEGTSLRPYIPNHNRVCLLPTAIQTVRTAALGASVIVVIIDAPLDSYANVDVSPGDLEFGTVTWRQPDDTLPPVSLEAADRS